MEFFRRVHQLATDEEEPLERAAKVAYAAFKNQTDIFANRVKGKT